MTGFVLQLQSSENLRQFENVRVFCGTDLSGSFSILSGHRRFITVLEYGLAKFRCHDQAWQYLALPGAVLYFNDNHLSLSSRMFLLHEDYQVISQHLNERILRDEAELKTVRQTLHQMETEILKRLWHNREFQEWV